MMIALQKTKVKPFIPRLESWGACGGCHSYLQSPQYHLNTLEAFPP